MIEISDVAELQAMSLDLSEDYVLVNDIDASETSGWNGGAGFVPVGDSSNRFTGSFDGQGFQIDGLFINRPGEAQVGLFGWFDSPSKEFKDVSITNAEITGGSQVGVAAGFGRGTTSHVHVSGTVSGGTSGGLIGDSNNGSCTNCSAAVSVTGSGDTGGFVGNSGGMDFLRCWARGNVSGGGDTGGFVGDATGSDFDECYATGTVSGAGQWKGGFGGRSAASSDFRNCYARGDCPAGAGFLAICRGTVENCYATGAASAGNGFSDVDDQGTPANSFWDTDTSGTAGSGGGTGKTTAEMTDVATYTDTSTEGLDNPWDFVGDPGDDEGTDDVWGIRSSFNDGYPFLTAIQSTAHVPPPLLAMAGRVL